MNLCTYCLSIFASPPSEPWRKVCPPLTAAQPLLADAQALLAWCLECGYSFGQEMFCTDSLHAGYPYKTLIRATPRYPVDSRRCVVSKSKKRQATARLEVRCFEEDAQRIKAKAAAAGISTSELLRRSALGKKILTKTDVRLMNELLRLGGLQKHLYTQMQSQMTTELSREFSEVLVALKKAIVAIDLQAVQVVE